MQQPSFCYSQSRAECPSSTLAASNGNDWVHEVKIKWCACNRSCSSRRAGNHVLCYGDEPMEQCRAGGPPERQVLSTHPLSKHRLSAENWKYWKTKRLVYVVFFPPGVIHLAAWPVVVQVWGSRLRYVHLPQNYSETAPCRELKKN